MGDKIVKSKNLCCQPVVFPSLSLLNGIEISSVVGGSVLETSKVIEFDYSDSDILMIEESSSAVFQFNSFSVVGCKPSK